ncbi:MAG: ECF-type sigma factor [bacterium]
MDVGAITLLLHRLRDGDAGSWHRLLPLVYDELRHVAGARVAGSRPGTLGATELVHEIYLKLSQSTSLDLVDRRHFFAVAALAMRQFLVDRARARRAGKRGGDRVRVELRDDDVVSLDAVEEVLAVHEALDHLRRVSERAARVAELRYFGGLSVEETAEILEVDPRTVKRDWRKARALLLEIISFQRRVP